MSDWPIAILHLDFDSTRHARALNDGFLGGTVVRLKSSWPWLMGSYHAVFIAGWLAFGGPGGGGIVTAHEQVPTDQLALVARLPVGPHNPVYAVVPDRLLICGRIRRPLLLSEPLPIIIAYTVLCSSWHVSEACRDGHCRQMLS